MLSVEQALEQILAHFHLLDSETIALADAPGRVLAEPIVAMIDLPPFANSSMDGFALRAIDSAPGAELTVIGDIPAGIAPTLTIGSGQAARIMTGAALPTGADAVIPVEATDAGTLGSTIPTTIILSKAILVGDCVRSIGEDLQRGETVLSAGRVLRPQDIGLLASLGIARVPVYRAPLVAILATGDELIADDDPVQDLPPGKIRNANNPLLAALVREFGAAVLDLGIARDTEADVERCLLRAVDAQADLIISSAGVSVGAYDVVKSVVERLGSLGFWKVNVRPGKPLAFGNVRGIPYIGLPGNPVSAFVTFDLFARPAIQKMAGRADQPPLTEAVTGEPMTSDGRRTYMRVRLEARNGLLVARSTGTQSSGALSSLVRADGLLIIPDSLTDVPIGTRLSVRLL